MNNYTTREERAQNEKTTEENCRRNARGGETCDGFVTARGKTETRTKIKLFENVLLQECVPRY